MNRCSFCEWIPILPCPICPLAGQLLLGQNVVVGAMTLLVAVRGKHCHEKYVGTPVFFTTALHHGLVWSDQAPEKPGPTGFDDLLDALAAEMETYKKPTAFVHGDTHIFHVSKPLLSKQTKRFFEHFTRIETFGDPDTHWVRITVDPSKPELFTIEPEIVPENKAN